MNDVPTDVSLSTKVRHLAGRCAPLLLFFVLPLALFWSQTIGGKSLIPFENLYQFEPWAAFAGQVGAGAPHNELINDLILENYAWKQFIVESIRARRLPLWNPYIFAGMPFLASGQHSALYPLTLFFLLMPLWKAYGWFTVITLTLAGINMYVLLRVLGMRRGAALLGGIVYQGSGFLTISVVFQMIIAGAAWLPLVLAMVAKLFQVAEAGETHPTAYIPWTAVGAIAIGLVCLAGHPETLYYVLLLTALYVLWRLGGLWLDWRRKPEAPYHLLLNPAVWSAMLGVTGLLLGSAQLIPLYELVRANFREGSVSFSEVLGWAYPPRQILTFLIPDFFGNPARHTFFDITTKSWRAITTRNVWGGTLDYVAWTQGLPSWKNYVEAASYVGILPLLLAGLALWYRRRDRHVRFFGLLVLVSLLFIFGTPAYAILYYGLPGWSQLHTPFRWVFPYTFAIAALAAIGWDAMVGRSRRARITTWWYRLPIVAGLAGLLLLAGAFLVPRPFLNVARRLMAVSELTRVAFNDDPALLISYQWLNFIWFSLFLALGGSAIWLARRGRGRWKKGATWCAVTIVGLDLFVAAYGFYPASEPRLIEFRPPGIEWLQQQPPPWRFTTLQKYRRILMANTAMFYGFHDVRGYDSIIPKHYVEYMQRIEEQGQLLFNRIAPLFSPDSLDDPLLDLLNVRYVATTERVERAGWQPVYDGEIRIYKNEDVLPRAFALPATQAEVRPREDILAELERLKPREEVWLEAMQGSADTGERGRRSASALTPARITVYSPNELETTIAVERDSVLVLSESWFPDWRAFRRPAGSPRENEVELDVWRANGTFRAVEVPAGDWVVRWKYSPNSVKLGFFVSFLGTVLLILGGAYWLWGRIYQPQEDEGDVRRVAKNSLAPMALTFLNKGVDTVFAAFMARILGPAGLGAYGFAIAIIWYFLVFSNFGLGTLLTREVARDKAAAGRYLVNTIYSRLLLFAVSAPVLLGVIWVWETAFALPRTTSWAIVLLAIGLIPSNISDVVTAVFRAFEKFEVPALVTTITTLLKVSIGAGVLLAGYGIIGLAATSIVTNVITLGILSALLVHQQLVVPSAGGGIEPGVGEERRTGVSPVLSFFTQWDAGFNRDLLKTAFPLMLNDFLSTAFFRMDMAILQPMKGDTVVGWYNVAYKFIDGLIIIPSTFTLAIFPVMSRYAEGARDSLLRATVLSLRWLLYLAFPICVLTTRYADGIIMAFGGPDYLPHSATALRLLIWFLPFSFINSLVHYVLIAVNQQRFLTRAFTLGVGFNLIANLLLIPRYSFYAAAINTVLSEIVLLMPFYYSLREHVGEIPWFTVFWRPAVAAGVMALPLWYGSLPFYTAIPVAGVLYVVAVLITGGVTDDDIGVLQQLLPRRYGRLVARAAQKTAWG